MALKNVPDLRTQITSGEFFSQVRVLTIANLKSRYRKTLAGFIWVMLNPIIMFSVQGIVFKHYLKLGTPNYALFLLTGLLPWIFMSQSIEMCTTCFEQNGTLMKSFPAHPLVYLLSQLADNSVNFLAAFFAILIPVWLSDPSHPLGLLLIPIPLAIMFMATIGIAWLLATLQVFFKDTRFLVNFGLSIGFFLTPIFYPPEIVPSSYHWLTQINPFHRLITPFRWSVYEFDLGRFLNSSVLALYTAEIILLLAWLVWRKKRTSLYINV